MRVTCRLRLTRTQSNCGVKLTIIEPNAGPDQQVLIEGSATAVKYCVNRSVVDEHQEDSCGVREHLSGLSSNIRFVRARCSYAYLRYGRYFLGSGAVADSACTMMLVTRQPPASLIA